MVTGPDELKLLEGDPALLDVPTAVITSRLDIPSYANDSDPPNGSFYIHTGENQIKFKDSNGNVRGSLVSGLPSFSADGNAPTDTLFFNSGDNQYKYKDSNGTVREPEVSTSADAIAWGGY